MLKKVFFGIAVVAIAGGVFGQAYKWVDESGVVHYSDRPEPGAEEFMLPTIRRASRPVSPVASRSASRSANTPAATSPTFSYESLIVAVPAAEETLWNIEGVLDVTLDLRPALQPGHSVRIYFDGTPQLVSSASFQIPEVYRGVHNLQAEVVDATGKLMIRSLSNRFYVQQNAIGN